MLSGLSIVRVKSGSLEVLGAKGLFGPVGFYRVVSAIQVMRNRTGLRAWTRSGGRTVSVSLEPARGAMVLTWMFRLAPGHTGERRTATDERMTIAMGKGKIQKKTQISLRGQKKRKHTFFCKAGREAVEAQFGCGIVRLSEVAVQTCRPDQGRYALERAQRE